MKLLCLLLAFLFAAPLLFAQSPDIDPAIQEAIKAVVPVQYAAYATLALVLVAAYSRFRYARKSGLDVIDSILAVLRGTNTRIAPLLIACLCMLSLSACGSFTKQDAVRAGETIAIGAAKSVILIARVELAQKSAEYAAALQTPGVSVNVLLLKEAAVNAAQQALDAAEKALARAQAKLDKQPVNVSPQAQASATPSLMPPPCLNMTIPDYGNRVAAVLAAE